MTDEAFYRFLGLCMRAGKLVSGEDTVLRLVRDRKVDLVLISNDASNNTEKLFHAKCQSYNTPIKTAGTREHLGRAIGKQERVVLGITDKGFAKKTDIDDR
ncbi:ribosomal L7Ae/L30e/S12e/Gadd45 family protein [Geomicrobium sp. JCM 19055]|uniref:L7Ae/L30e/S12e/Gadd45 family ribosomal protein n=1 Tax=Geomicrobium sp. JCM 19055 TaxID=1460649 RepID=UPI00045ED390|nr:ribosomal L7Ae/L30e/S12e/Gadd45 family protein [Geomicrobium sp. JCM 19055]GAK01534.1 ribosomal protein L7Ae family protein [Geomicrobium sp. JCM 19055]